MPLTSDPTLDQIRVFLAAASQGGFSAAARALNRAQPSVSYAIAELERSLGLTLFDRTGTGAGLTLAGRALLEEATEIAALADRIRARALAMRSGLEADLTLCVDVMYPAACLGAHLAAFAAAFPTVRLSLSMMALGGVAQEVLAGRAQLGLAGSDAGTPDGLQRARAAEVTLLPVAAPAHALAGLESIDLRTASAHVQLVLTDPSAATSGRSFGVLSRRQWRIDDLAAKHALLLAGLGWGNMPEHMVAADIAAGRLVRLAVAAAPSHTYPIDLIWRSDIIPGPAASWLAAQLAAASPAAVAAAAGP